MTAKVKITIGNTTYKQGEKITQKLNKADEAFLLREGYISDDSKKTDKEVKTGEDIPSASTSKKSITK